MGPKPLLATTQWDCAICNSGVGRWYAFCRRVGIEIARIVGPLLVGWGGWLGQSYGRQRFGPWGGLVASRSAHGPVGWSAHGRPIGGNVGPWSVGLGWAVGSVGRLVGLGP